MSRADTKRTEPEFTGAAGVAEAATRAAADPDRGAVRVRYDIGIRELVVLRTERIAPRMIRVVLGGPQVAGFQSHLPDEHVRFVFPDPDTGRVRAPVPDGRGGLDWPSPFPPSREYSVRGVDREAGEIWFDFVVHPGGVAADWAAAAEPGDTLHVAGPPGGLYVPEHYDVFVLAADESGLPPLARILERLPDTARGYAFVEVDGPADELDLVAPAGVTVRWLHRDGTAAGRSDVLAREVPATVRIEAGQRPFVWLAAEAGSLKLLRRWVRDELRVPRRHTSITGYWKVGEADEHVHYDEDEE